MTDDSTALTASASNGHEEPSDGVRTYRGKKLEDILPRIREELGADAIVLREREGLVGGFGGFFAQRFIEVQARRGGPSIDVYDEDGETEPLPHHAGTDGDSSQDFLLALRHAASAWTEDDPAPQLPEQVGADVAELSIVEPERSRRLQSHTDAEPLVSEPITDALSAAPPQPPVEFDELEELRAQTRAEPARKPTQRTRRPAQKLAAKPAQQTAKPARATAKPARHTAKPAQHTAKPTRATAKPAQHTAKPARATAKPARATAGKPAARSATPSIAAPPTPPTTPTPTQPPPPPAVQPAASAVPSAAAPHTSAAPPSLPTPAPTGRDAGTPYRTRARPQQASTSSAAAEAALPPSSALRWSASRNPVPPPMPAPDTSAEHSRRRMRLRDAITRRLNPGTITAPSTAAGFALDTAAAATITRDLTARGVSGAMASALIAEAAAHGRALAEGHSLRAAARAQLVRRIVQPPPLPATGAAIAFAGAGGAGKTSCAAALASAYASASTLTVSALSLHAPDGGRALAELLRATRVGVHAVDGAQAARAVTERRHGGLVILDTVAVRPGDLSAMRALGAELEPLALDAIYIALPATLGPQAARGVLGSFAALTPTAVAITHADETDQLGVAVEIAAANRIPLVYVHAGTDPRTALGAVDALAIATRLLP
ncbi:MAG: hypothetical protein ACLP8S_18025 [Solirubrobacteraceae bacterium]